MKNQNRPYSLINIFDNLHGAIKKSQLQNILDSLTKEEKLIMKLYGSTKIYLCNQNLFPSVSEEELNSLDKKINEKREENKIIKDNINLKNNELKTITNSFTDEELNKKIKELKKELEIKKKKVGLIENGEIEKINIDKMKIAEKNYEDSLKKYKKIKKICMGIFDQIAESMDITTKKIMDKIGVENDNEIIKQKNIIL
jgi:hypothetical protein